MILENYRTAPLLSPSWSPDGTKIAYSRGAWPRERQEIAVIDRDGRNERMLTVNDRDDTDPSWAR